MNLHLVVPLHDRARRDVPLLARAHRACPSSIEHLAIETDLFAEDPHLGLVGHVAATLTTTSGLRCVTRFGSTRATIRDVKTKIDNKTPQRNEHILLV